MNDMREVIVPRSDQLNSDDLIAGPMTIKITKVDIRPGTEQPVSVWFEEDNGKPWKPCKSMCRAMVICWGPDASQYIGKSLTIYCDPQITWGGMAVGGIRISHMSHIDNTQTMALTATKGKKKPFTVKPLAAPKPVPPPPLEIDTKLLVDADVAANLGVISYQRFWKSLTNVQRNMLLPEHDKLKAKAKAADDAAAADEMPIENAPENAAEEQY
jgi:hypothetical protein